MAFDLNELQSCLATWPRTHIPQDVAGDALLERIRQVLHAALPESAIQKADFIPLIRHLLLRETIKKGCKQNLRVPTSDLWPSVGEWNNHGISAMTVGEDAFLLVANKWRPTWLEGSDSGVFTDAFSSTIVRENGYCAADPFIVDVTGYELYSSPGQREAVRAAFLMPSGGTLIVNLPTGSGKSLAGQAPVLLQRHDGNLTIFVVPTVALAIDQERQMHVYFRKSRASGRTWPLAWYDGVSEQDRAEIKQRMLNGTQRILFTSPESLTTSLLRTVSDVAKNGMLRYLVIDEAHLITQWGDEFRPSFQALAGLRNSLLQHVPNSVEKFRTLLLSATFTPETIETLANLFGPPKTVQALSAVHLRPEPQYWNSRANSFNEKKDRILEALRHAPRPFILYVTTREDALIWQNILSIQAGYKRIDRFDGSTPSHKRREILHNWIITNNLDGIVATSAFGVGIDKNDVRTIMHATIPETMDRFYQEVGRGGRDGRHSISLLVYDNTDWKLPESLATPRLISDELGYARWKALYDSRENAGFADLFRINLDAIRQGLSGSSEENIKWNMRTLLLMSRAGFLELDVVPIDRNDEVDDYSPTSPLAAMSSFRVRLLRNDHMLKDVWETTIKPSREKTWQAGNRSLRLMGEYLREGREVSEILAELYTNTSKQWPVDVTKVCGGCPKDRFSETRSTSYHVPTTPPIYNISDIDVEQWQLTFPYLDPRFVLIFYSSATTIQTIIKFVKWAVSICGVQELCSDEHTLLSNTREWRSMYLYAPSGIVIHRSLSQLNEEPYSPLARVTYFESQVKGCDLDRLKILDRPMHLILFPETTRDPNNNLRFISDTAMNSEKLSKLCEVISQ